MIIILILLFIQIIFINSQDVYPIDKNAKCEKYLGDTDIVKCSEYLINKNSVYIPGSSSQTALFGDLTMYFKLLGSYGGSNCQTVHTSQSLCSMVLAECEQFEDKDTKEIIAIPKRVCRETCTDVTSICGVNSFYNCSQIETDTLQPKYPITNSIYNLTNYGQSFNYSIDCFSPPPNDTSTVTKSCPPPLIYRYTTTQDEDKNLGYVYVSNQSLCTIPCPAPIMSTKKWSELIKTSDALSFISLICSIYIVITYLFINKKRNKYDYFFSFFTGSIILMSIAGTMGLFSSGSGETIICPEENRRAVKTDKACAASGFILQFGMCSAAIWWVIQSFELWFQIHFVNKKLNLMKFYIPIVFILSLVFSVPLLAIGQFRAGLGNFLCWIEGEVYQNTFLFGPLGVLLTIGTVFIFLVVYEIYRIMISNRKGDFWKLQFKPLFSVFLVYLTFIYLFGYNFWIHDVADTFYNSITDFYTCLLTTDGSNCLIKGPSPSSMKMFAFCLRIYGVYCVILYGFNFKARRIWRESTIGVYLLNTKLIGKLKSFSSNSKGTSSTVKMESTTAGGTSQMDSVGVSSSIDDDNGVTIY